MQMNLRTVTTAVTTESEGARVKFTAEDKGHVPYNKRRWEVHSCLGRLTVEDYDGSKPVNPGGWTSITLEEHENYESGRSVSRTISFILHADERKALIQMLGGRI